MLAKNRAYGISSGGFSVTVRNSKVVASMAAISAFDTEGTEVRVAYSSLKLTVVF